MNLPRAFTLAVLLALAGAASLAGCAAQHEPPSPAVVASPAALRAGEPGPLSADRAMRITIDTSLEVANLDEAGAAVRAAVARAGGYLGEARVAGGDEHRSAWFEAHVPVGNLPAFRADIAKLGDIVSDSEKAEDVTEQRADIKARLANARATEKRLVRLLEERTGSLADVVAVEKELGAARETIERMEAQERVLEGQIQSATVKLHLATRHAGGHLGPGRRIARAAGDGLRNAGSFLVGAAVVTASAGPTLLLLAAFGYAIFRAVRFLARRSAKR